MYLHDCQIAKAPHNGFIRALNTDKKKWVGGFLSTLLTAFGEAPGNLLLTVEIPIDESASRSSWNVTFKFFFAWAPVVPLSPLGCAGVDCVLDVMHPVSVWTSVLTDVSCHTFSISCKSPAGLASNVWISIISDCEVILSLTPCRFCVGCTGVQSDCPKVCVCLWVWSYSG